MRFKIINYHYFILLNLDKNSHNSSYLIRDEKFKTAEKEDYKQGGGENKYVFDELGNCSDIKLKIHTKNSENNAHKVNVKIDENEIAKMKEKALTTIKKKYISKFAKEFKVNFQNAYHLS